MTERAYRIAALLVLLACAVACGGTGSQRPAGLSVHPLLGDSDEFVKRWNAAPIGVPPEIESLAQTVPDRPVWVACIVSGFAKDDHGFANLRVDLELIGPQGQSVLQHPGFAAYDRKPEPGRTTVLVGSDYTVTLEQDDPAGTYEVRVRVTDLVSGAGADGQARVELGS